MKGSFITSEPRKARARAGPTSSLPLFRRALPVAVKRATKRLLASDALFSYGMKMQLM